MLIEHILYNVQIRNQDMLSFSKYVFAITQKGNAKFCSISGKIFETVMNKTAREKCLDPIELQKGCKYN